MRAIIGRMKTCTGCHQAKSLDDFTKRTKSRDGRSPRCRLCTRAAVQGHYERRADYYRDKQRKRRKELRARFVTIVREAKSAPCMDCGLSFPYYAMDLDHVTGKKKFILSKASSVSANEEVLRAEIAKCEAVCATCHRIRTWTRKHTAP